jgi:D-glycero-beta-D-manno-heptose 1-phosphate adenylyltransferase
MTHSAQQKIYALEDLQDDVADLKAEGKTVVTTNGVFDVFHVGHLRYLEQAASYGDALIVLINSDASVRRLKGLKRPIVSEAERAEVIAGLSCVAAVCLFEADSPIDALLALCPTTHVKGGDYNQESLPEAPQLKMAGVKLAFIPVIEGKSTTNIIDRILTLHAAP